MVGTGILVPVFHHWEKVFPFYVLYYKTHLSSVLFVYFPRLVILVDACDPTELNECFPRISMYLYMSTISSVVFGELKFHFSQYIIIIYNVFFLAIMLTH